MTAKTTVVILSTLVLLADVSGDVTVVPEPQEVDLLYGSLGTDGLTIELEDASFHAQESGLSAPWLFGVHFSRRIYVVSLFAGRGQLSLGTMAHRQDALPYPEDTPEI